MIIIIIINIIAISIKIDNHNYFIMQINNKHFFFSQWVIMKLIHITMVSLYHCNVIEFVFITFYFLYSECD